MKICQLKQTLKCTELIAELCEEDKVCEIKKQENLGASVRRLVFVYNYERRSSRAVFGVVH